MDTHRWPGTRVECRVDGRVFRIAGCTGISVLHRSPSETREGSFLRFLAEGPAIHTDTQLQPLQQRFAAAETPNFPLRRPLFRNKTSMFPERNQRHGQEGKKRKKARTRSLAAHMPTITPLSEVRNRRPGRGCGPGGRKTGLCSDPVMYAGGMVFAFETRKGRVFALPCLFGRRTATSRPTAAGAFTFSFLHACCALWR